MGVARTSVEILVQAKDMATRELAGVTTELQNLGAAGRQTSSEFLARVDEDIRTATADFKAGMISVGDYRTALQMARAEAVRLRQNTQLTGKDLGVFNRIMDQTTQRTVLGGKSTRTLVSSFISLGQAASGVQGPLGQVARTALLLGSGGLVAASLALGVAGVTALYNAWTREARETKKANEELFKTIEDGAKAIIPETIVREQQRQALDRMGAELTQRRTKLEAALARVRTEGQASLDVEIVLLDNLEKLQQQEVDLLVKRAQLRRIAADEATQVFERQRDELLLEGRLLGLSEEAQFRLRLETQKLTAVQIEALEVLRRTNFERARALQLAEMAELRASTAAIGEARGRALALAPTQLRGARPESATPATQAPSAPELGFLGEFREGFFGPEMVDGVAQATSELDHFGATLGDVIAQGFQFQDAFLQAFIAVREGSASVGKAFGEAIQRGVAQAAAAKGAFYLQEAVAAFAMGLLGDPKGFAAAAKFTAAAAGMFALSHIAAGGVSLGGGGGRGGSGGGAQARATEATREKEPGTIVVQGGLLDMSNPQQAEALARAIERLAGRRVIVMGA